LARPTSQIHAPTVQDQLVTRFFEQVAGALNALMGTGALAQTAADAWEVTGTIPDSGVVAGSYTLGGFDVGADGRLTDAHNGTGTEIIAALGYTPGTVTSITAGTGLSGGVITTSGTISIATTGVSAGSYTLPSITVNAQGQVTTISNGLVAETQLNFTDILTANVSTTKHGLTPKLPNDATKFLDGTGAYTVPPGTGTGTVTTSGSPVAGELAYFTGASAISTIVAGGDFSLDSAFKAQFRRTITPQGRLCLVTGTAFPTADQTAKTSIFYTPAAGNIIPIYDGTNQTAKVFAELTLSLDTSNHLLENVYDVFVWNNAGTIAIGAGPAWVTSATITVTIATPAVVSWTAHGLSEGMPVVFTNSGGALPTGITAGTTYYVGRSPAANTFNISTTIANAAAGTFVATSGSQSGAHTGKNHTTARGTGAGTTELERKNGLWTNKNSITLTNGAGAGTAGVAANTATYVGSFYCTANGQTGLALRPAAASGGSNTIMGLYNAYNRHLLQARSMDSTATWTYNSTPAVWRAANANVANRVWFLDGLQESPVGGFYKCDFFTAAVVAATIGINLDSTNGTPAVCCAGQTNNNSNISGPIMVQDHWLPVLGFHYLQASENALGGAGANATFAANSTVQRQALIIQIEV
jgi:hypothetical protein